MQSKIYIKRGSYEKKDIFYNGEKYKYLGNGCKATVAKNGWKMSSDIYFRSIDCGYLMNGNPNITDNCSCGSLHKDSDYGRLSSKHGDDSIEVFGQIKSIAIL